MQDVVQDMRVGVGVPAHELLVHQKQLALGVVTDTVFGWENAIRFSCPARAFRLREQAGVHGVCGIASCVVVPHLGSKRPFCLLKTENGLVLFQRILTNI